MHCSLGLHLVWLLRKHGSLAGMRIDPQVVHLAVRILLLLGRSHGGVGYGVFKKSLNRNTSLYQQQQQNTKYFARIVVEEGSLSSVLLRPSPPTKHGRG